MQARHLLGVHHDADLPLRADPVDGPAGALEVAGVADVDRAALGVHDDVVEELRRGGERLGLGEVGGPAAGEVDPHDAVLVGDVHQLAGEDGEPLGVVEPGDERGGLAVGDHDDGAVAVLVELADLADVDLAAGPDDDRLGVLESGDERRRHLGGGRGEPGV